MGQWAIRGYKKYVKREYKFAFLFTFITALLVHIYKFTNTLPNHDSVLNYCTDQNVLGSGRWALSIVCSFSSYYDLPWVTGLLSCLFIALTVVAIVAIFKITNPALIAITGGLLSASPATTETLFFQFTADGYMIAMFLAALGVYLSRMEEHRWYCWIFSGVCICICCAIYQAYVSFALVLSLCYFMFALLSGKYTKKKCFSWILLQLLLYASSLLVYYIVWKLLMASSGITANDYQGISELGLNAGVLIHGIVQTVEDCLQYFLQWNIFEHGFTAYNSLNILCLLFMVAGLIIACIKSGLHRRVWALVLLVICLVLIVPCAFIWNFTSESVIYVPRMLQSLTLLFVFTGLIYEKYAVGFLKNTVCVLLVLMFLNYGLMANICYFYMNEEYERSYSEGVELMIDIHNIQDEYDVTKIAVVGNRAKEAEWSILDEETGKAGYIGQVQVIIGDLEKTLFNSQSGTIPFLQHTFGLELLPATNEELEQLFEMQQVKDMPCWPAQESIIVIDDMIVIKLSDNFILPKIYN